MAIKEHKSAKQADEKPVGRSTVRKKKSSAVNDVITGDFIISERLRKWYPLMLWVVLLVFIYIGVNFRHQRLQRTEIQQRIQLNEERSRAVIFSSMRMNASRHSRITEEVRRRGIPLEESAVPPKKL